MRGLTRPLTIFTSKKSFDDRFADDMQFGDMNELTLKKHYALDQVSTLVDWSTYKSPYFHSATRNIPPRSKEKVVSMLFDELRTSSRFFSFVGAFVALLVAIFLVWMVVRPVSIVRVDGGAVYVHNLPLTTEGKISWWNENKRLLRDKYSIIRNPSHFTIVIMNFGGYVSPPTGSNDGSIDDYHCFNDIKNDNKCIYNDISMVVSGSLDNKVFISVDGKTYVQLPNGKVALLSKS